ncbi:MAG: TonB-dependent receptor [Gammaproteobacteria bacterium]
MTSRRSFLTPVQTTTVAVSCILAMSMSARAQEKPKSGGASTSELQEIVVTGSRIARPDLDRLEPTTIVNSATFDERGYLDVGQALSEVPAFGIQPSSAVNTQAAFGIAQSFVDLYSLGSQRTLVLVNGRRFVSSNTASFAGSPASPGQQVDLNTIPTKLIERVETISVGGAPIYGADAIAGTVNIILKKDFEGLDVDAQAGVSDHKDAWNYRARALAGTNFADGRGNLTAVLEFNKSDGLTGNARKNFSQDLGFLKPAASGGPFKTVLTSDNAVSSVNTSGIPMLDDGFYAPAFGLDPATIGITSPTGQLLAFGPGKSTLQPYNLGTQTGNPIFWKGGDGIRLSQFSNLLSPQERINFDTLGHFALTDHLNLFTEGWFSETHATNIIAQPAYNAALFGGGGTVNGNFIVAANNPFLSAADQALIQNELNAYGAAQPFGPFLDPNWDGRHFYLGRANTDLESGVATASQVLARGVVGLNGDFSIGYRNFTWEVAANYGSSSNTSHQPAYVFQNVQNALNSTLNSSGQIVCAGNPVAAPIATASSTCAPLNLFGLGSPSLLARQYITHLAEAQSVDTQRDLTANLTGDVVKLPAGEVKVALGFENRRETAKFTPDSFYTGGFGQLSASDVSGAYHTNELYAETQIPIFAPAQDIPVFHSLELDGAIRRVDNSIAGSANTWTAGLIWSPVKDVQLRANKTRSIRAPAVTELFLPSSTGFEFANDPCDAAFIGQGTAPATRAKNCAAAGIPSGFVSNVVNATAQGTTSGNATLQSETADSKTFGVVLRPRWIPRASLSLDYVEINVTNAIEQLTLVNLMDACYDSTNYPNDPSCSSFTRNAQHQVAGFHDGYVNAGYLQFQGIQGGIDYAFTLPNNLGNLEWRLSYLDTRKLSTKIASASANEQDGELGALIATPKGKGTIAVNYNKGPFTWFWQAQYYSGMNFNNQNTSTSQDILRVNPWWLINSTISYDVAKSFSVRLIVDNVFDKEPPFPALAAGTGGNFAGATSLYFPGIIGRTYVVAANFRF